MKKRIVKNPNPVLFLRAKEIPPENILSPEIQNIIQQMKEALQKTPEGIGLAAPQIGYSLRIFLASEEALRWKKTEEKNDESKKKWDYYVFINPAIAKTSHETKEDIEGCLSIPGTYGTVTRSEKVTVTAHDETGKKFTRGTSHLYARVMQHEIDHLNGVLFISKAKDIKKLPEKHTE